MWTQPNLHKWYSILIIIDDFSDDPSFSRHSKLLHAYVHGEGIIAVQQ